MVCVDSCTVACIFLSFLFIIIIIIICLCLCVPCVRSHNKYIRQMPPHVAVAGDSRHWKLRDLAKKLRMF